MGEYQLKHIWNREHLQESQADYAYLSDMAVWMMDQEEEMVGTWCPGEFMPQKMPLELREEGRKMEQTDDFVQVVCEEQLWMLSKRILFLEGHVIGYCMFAYTGMDAEPEHKKRIADFWLQIVQRSIQDHYELDRLDKKVNELMRAEETMKLEQRRLQQENDYDELTRVHSRAFFYRKMEEYDAREDLLPISIVVGDVNNLKFTNDMFGHRHGDMLLRKVADVLQEKADEMKVQTGNEFIVARCGGDEFNILMPHTKRGEANYYCHLVAEQLKKETSCCLVPSISLGASKKSEVRQSLSRLLETADAKMYSAKREFKKEQDPFEEIMKILFARKYLDEKIMDHKMQLVEEFVTSLGWSSDRITKSVKLMRYQDIGLTIVPERVYCKKGAYTEREWREIKKHPQLGKKLALIRSDMAPISEMMYMTHENVDGSGWPCGIKRDKLIEEVLAVRLVTEYVDCENKNGTEEACNYLERESGRIFDSELTKDFLRFLKNM